MKFITIAAISLLTIAFVESAGQYYYCYPASAASPDSLFVSFDDRAWKYSLPDLNLKVSKTYNQHLCGPATVNNNVVTFAASDDNNNSTDLQTSDLSIADQRNSASPALQNVKNPCFEYSGSNFCFVRDDNANKTFIQRKNGDTVLESVQLPIPDIYGYYLYFDADIQGRIHVITNSGFYRTSTILQYYSFATNPLRIIRGPIALPHTANSGCPAEPASCAVDVLLTDTLKIRNDIVSYLWSIKQGDDFQVTIETYDARCNSFKSVRLGQGLDAGSRCESTTSAPSSAPSSSTSAPSSSNSPSSSASQSTTGAPNPSDISGDNNARSNDAVKVGVTGIAAVAVVVCATLL